MFFDSPADPRDYPWRITWMAEHNDESTLSLFASDFQNELAGPGIGLARYGGAMFLFPPREIMDVWHDFRLDFTDTLEERLLAGACMHSRERHIAVLSELPARCWLETSRQAIRQEAGPCTVGTIQPGNNSATENGPCAQRPGSPKFRITLHSQFISISIPGKTELSGVPQLN